MHWERRRDLEGGKELGVWLLLDKDENVETELYVESHEYRGGKFDVYTTSAKDDEWAHHGEFETPHEAFEQARSMLEASPHEVREL